jgi:hypothetical protein
MKYYFSAMSALLLTISVSVHAQDGPSAELDVGLEKKVVKPEKKIKAVGYARSLGLAALQKQYESNLKSGKAKKEKRSGEINILRLPPELEQRGKRAQEAEQNSGLKLSSAFDFVPVANAPNATISVEGYSNDDNASVNGTRITPPDTNGDVGLTHYVQYVNLGWVFFNKDGTTAGGPFAGNIFWQGFGGVCETENAGDPIVLYDHLAGRWLFSQFTGGSIADGHQCVAITDGEDPTGPYTLYDFIVSPGAFNDYPKIGVWPDGYYMTTHEFAGGSFAGVNVTIFDRDAMLAGDPNAGFIQFENVGAGSTFGAQIGHLEGPDLPPAGTCNHMVHATDVQAFGIGGADRLRMWEVCADFDNPSNSSFTEVASVAVPAFDQNFCGFSRDCIDQPGTQALDGVAGFTMYRFNNRYFPSEGVLKSAVTTNVDVGGDRAGVMWVGLDINPTTGVASVGDNGDLVGVVDFNDGLNRWMGSASVDSAGNIGIGYTRSSSTSFPSIYFTVHERGVDGPGQVQTEQVCVDGTGSTTGANRWADYASTSVDPVDNCTFWHTNEYVETTGSFEWNTRVCAFTVASCTGGGEPPPPPPPVASCSFEDDFGTSTGWTIDPSSDCSTGTYVRTNPTQQTVAGIITQPGGDSDGNGFAVFTATNTSVGNADVDGGVCVARSPNVTVNEASQLSIDWFHGQRDTGDDPGGDFYRLEFSTNGGASFNSLVDIGDVRTEASWTNATANIPAGSDVIIRVSISDGSGPGDIIEGGIDNVSICSTN